ncbi:MAG: ATP-grasp domain-containing protein [Paenibacillaceae bacterium]
MKKLMVLGAGISQLPLIQTARKMGLYVIVLSSPGNYPGFAWADQIYYEDTTNIEKVLEISRIEQINGICTTGTDVAVKAIGRVADKLGLNGVSYEAALMSSNKWSMKQAFIDHGVRTAKFMRVTSLEEAYVAIDSLSLPLIFKAVDSGASKGIVKVEHTSQVKYAYEAVMQATRQDYFIVEQFIEGIEFGAQAFIYNHTIQFVMPHGDLMFYGDAGVPIGHHVPYELPDRVASDIHMQLERSVHALGLNNCAINADFIWNDQEVYVLEVGGRAGATCLPEIVSTFYGFDYYEQMVRVALGMNPNFQIYASRPCACELLIAEETGEIVSIVDTNQPHPNIIQISKDYAIGSRVSKFKVGTDRIGQIIVTGNSLDATMQLLAEVKRNITITINHAV